MASRQPPGSSGDNYQFQQQQFQVPRRQRPGAIGSPGTSAEIDIYGGMAGGVGQASQGRPSIPNRLTSSQPYTPQTQYQPQTQYRQGQQQQQSSSSSNPSSFSRPAPLSTSTSSFPSSPTTSNNPFHSPPPKHQGRTLPHSSSSQSSGRSPPHSPPVPRSPISPTSPGFSSSTRSFGTAVRPQIHGSQMSMQPQSRSDKAEWVGNSLDHPLNTNKNNNSYNSNSSNSHNNHPSRTPHSTTTPSVSPYQQQYHQQQQHQQQRAPQPPQHTYQPYRPPAAHQPSSSSSSTPFSTSSSLPPAHHRQPFDTSSSTSTPLSASSTFQNIDLEPPSAGYRNAGARPESVASFSALSTASHEPLNPPARRKMDAPSSSSKATAGPYSKVLTPQPWHPDYIAQVSKNKKSKNKKDYEEELKSDDSMDEDGKGERMGVIDFQARDAEERRKAAKKKRKEMMFPQQVTVTKPKTLFKKARTKVVTIYNISKTGRLAQFSNERLYLHWMQFGMLQGSIALLLISFSTTLGQWIGVGAVILTMLTLVYSTSTFHVRHLYMVQKRKDVLFYERWIPTALVVGLIALYGTNVVLAIMYGADAADDMPWQKRQPGDLVGKFQAASRFSTVSRTFAQAADNTTSAAPGSEPASTSETTTTPSESATTTAATTPITNSFDTPLQAWLRDLKTNEPKDLLQIKRQVFGAPLRKDILHRVVVWQRDAERQGTHSTKGRSEVSGTTRKAAPQKGRGAARVGSLRAPQRRGGGIVFGPKPRDHSSDLPKKVQLMGLRVALSTKYAQDQLVVVDSLASLDSHKTRDFERLQRLHGWDSVFVVASKENDNLAKATQNLQTVDVALMQETDVLRLLKREFVVMDRASLRYLEKKLSA
ncbi:54S ribosomal protein L4 mitochondrial [Actinomortierella ambigua]|nr:54S ribosomal protein L4 mitochondrial [Actinomortierella ambigua]